MDQGRYVGFLKSASDALLYLVTAKCKYVSYDCAPLHTEVSERDGSFFYRVQIPVGADFLEKITFPLAVVDLKIVNSHGDIITQCSKGNIDKVVFESPVPQPYISPVYLEYKLDLSCLRDDSWDGDHLNSILDRLGLSVFTMRMVEVEDRPINVSYNEGISLFKTWKV